MHDSAWILTRVKWLQGRRVASAALGNWFKGRSAVSSGQNEGFKIVDLELQFDSEATVQSNSSLT